MTMRTTIAVVALLAWTGCTDDPASYQQSVVCTGDKIPIYTPRFLPQSGGSGVASGADAARGQTNPSDPAAEVPPADPSNTAMIVTCGTAPCAPGQVAVDVPQVTGGGGGVGGGGDTIGPAAEPPPQPVAQQNLVCAAPPPACEVGMSPQYTEKGQWECTDCSLVVTYGGIYGNYRRCVSLPRVACPEGEVPTWVYESDSWECQPTCDNGQYDQHTIGGMLVCVPC